MKRGRSLAETSSPSFFPPRDSQAGSNEAEGSHGSCQLHAQWKCISPRFWTDFYSVESNGQQVGIASLEIKREKESPPRKEDGANSCSRSVVLQGGWSLRSSLHFSYAGERCQIGLGCIIHRFAERSCIHASILVIASLFSFSDMDRVQMLHNNVINERVQSLFIVIC